MNTDPRNPASGQRNPSERSPEQTTEATLPPDPPPSSDPEVPPRVPDPNEFPKVARAETLANNTKVTGLDEDDTTRE